MKKSTRYSKVLGLIKELGLTQSDVAERADYNISVLNAKLNGKAPVTISDIERISAAIGIPREKVGYYWLTN